MNLTTINVLNIYICPSFNQGFDSKLIIFLYCPALILLNRTYVITNLYFWRTVVCCFPKRSFRFPWCSAIQCRMPFSLSLCRADSNCWKRLPKHEAFLSNENFPKCSFKIFIVVSGNMCLSGVYLLAHCSPLSFSVYLWGGSVKCNQYVTVSPTFTLQTFVKLKSSEVSSLTLDIYQIDLLLLIILDFFLFL